MKTSITNRIRYVLDELLPRFLRDSPVVMWPMFLIWFRGRHVRTAMNFKRIAPTLTDAQFREVYRNVRTLADDRPTDTHPDALAFVLERLRGCSGSLLDVGCGRGYVLQEIQKQPGLEALRLFGCDLRDRVPLGRGRYFVGMTEALPVRDRAFDYVLCFHTLEHMRQLPAAIAELRRVTRRKLIVIVPRQKEFFYTFDLHLQFFPDGETLARAMGVPGEIHQFGSDLVFVGDAPAG